MDYNKLSKLQRDNPQTRSDTFMRQPSDLQDWKDIIKSQNVGIAKQEKIAWRTKEALPVIGQTSPRQSDVSNNITLARKNLQSRSFHIESHVHLENDIDQIRKSSNTPTFGKWNKKERNLSNQGLLTRSMDVFPTHVIPRKMSRLRPLGPHRLTSVPELRGPSAFRHKQPVDLFDMPERPTAPSPKDFDKTIDDNIDFSNSQLNVEYPVDISCPNSTPEPKAITTTTNNDLNQNVDTVGNTTILNNNTVYPQLLMDNADTENGLKVQSSVGGDKPQIVPILNMNTSVLNDKNNDDNTGIIINNSQTDNYTNLILNHDKENEHNSDKKNDTNEKLNDKIDPCT